MKIKTEELTGILLDYAVTTIEAPDALRYGVADWREQRKSKVVNGEYVHRYHQSWNQAGPIIERENIQLTTIFVHDLKLSDTWGAYLDDGRDFVESMQPGPTPLIAAMRCFVASKLGDEVEIPEELT